MSISKITILSLVLGAAAVASLGAADPPGGGNTDRSTGAPFQSPIIALTLMSDADDLVLLKNVEERALGERKFLVGVGVDDEKTPDWRNGKRSWIAVDDVQQIVEFDSIDDFHKALELRKGNDEKSAAIPEPATGLAAR